MIVLDASAAIDWFLHTPTGLRIEKRIYSRNESLHAPNLIDIEIVQVLRRLTRQGSVSESRASEALQVLLDLRLARYHNFELLPRIWQLRNNLSAYDAAYVALAEQLNATLITCDSRISLAPGHTANIEVF